MKIITSKLLIGVMLLMGLVPAIVIAADQAEIKALNDAKVNLVEAIQVAENEVGGKASEASIDDDSFTPQYEVNVIKDNRSFEVRVDALTGKLIGTREDLDD